MVMRFLWILSLSIFGYPAMAADTAAVLDTAERHIRLQTQGMTGKVTITMGQVDASRLPPCNALEAFTPQGTRFQGRTSVGIRCLTPNSWSMLIPAQITVIGNYVATARPLIAGQAIQITDLVVLEGDMSHLPSGALRDPGNAVGKTLRNSLSAGQVLRNDQLLAPIVIRQNQTVRVISTGSGFSVSTEGKALSNASIGQIVQVRMTSGQTVSGVARSDGNVEVSF